MVDQQCQRVGAGGVGGVEARGCKRVMKALVCWIDSVQDDSTTGTRNRLALYPGPA